MCRKSEGGSLTGIVDHCSLEACDRDAAGQWNRSTSLYGPATIVLLSRARVSTFQLGTIDAGFKRTFKFQIVTSPASSQVAMGWLLIRELLKPSHYFKTTSKGAML
jgi:hypothetical protein